MREIKFRGITFKGDFVYGDLINDATGLSFNESQWIRNNLTENKSQDNPTAYWNTTTKRIHWKEGNARCNAPVKPETVGQYTGLKDKNGVEIYEGDILRHYDHRGCKDGEYFQGEVVFKSGGWSGVGCYSEWTSCEVIGNIYQPIDVINKNERLAILAEKVSIRNKMRLNND